MMLQNDIPEIEDEGTQHLAILPTRKQSKTKSLELHVYSEQNKATGATRWSLAVGSVAYL